MRVFHKLLRPLAALCLALALLPAALALDLDTPCSITLGLSNPAMAEDLAQADVVVDLYRIARAEAAAGYDAYTFAAESGYESLTIAPDADGGWQTLSQAAARLVQAQPPSRTEALGATVALDEPGLYLLIAHGRDQKNYWQTVQEDGGPLLYSQAFSSRYEYKFPPVVVSVPTKAGGSTDAPGPWQYAVEADLKPQRSPATGTLEIVKTLRRYQTGTSPVAVFRIEAELDGARVYSDVASLRFDGPGQKTIQVAELPAGAVVTVEELYSGAGYRQTSPDPAPVTILRGQTVRVRFVNEAQGTSGGGQGVTNHFTRSGGGAWQWETPSDNS